MSQARQLLDRRGWTVVVVLVVFWALSVLARLLWNGEVYGLNYGVLHGDGACYALSAFSYAGDPDKGIREINAAYAEAGVPIVDLTDPDVCDNIKLGARVLYPLLSAPFVKAIGLEGMFVVPAVSWLLAVLIPATMLLRRRFVLGPLIAGSLALASTSVARWSVANITDALLMGLSALMLALLPLGSNRVQTFRIVGIGFLVVLASLTRQSWPIWIGMVTLPWIGLALRKGGSGWRATVSRSNPWFVLVLTVVPIAIGSHLLISAMLGSQNAAHLANVVQRQFVAMEVETPTPVDNASADSAPPSEVESPVVEAAPTSPSESQATVSEQSAPVLSVIDSWIATGEYMVGLATQVVITDVGQLVVLDRTLLVLLGLAFLGTFFNQRWSGSYVFIGVLGTTIALSLLNTTLGVNFRFQLPAVPFIVLLAGTVIVRNRADMRKLWPSERAERR